MAMRACVRARSSTPVCAAHSPEMTNNTHAHLAGSPCTALARTSLTARPLALVVEDHEDTRFLLRVILESRGLRVVEAADGEEGVRAAEELHPDLILMDWSLPRMDGLAAMRLVRERAALSHIPVVFLSGHAIPEWQREAREAGCSDYLVKPLDMGQLDRVLSRHLLLRVITGPAAQSRLSTRGIL
jgi:two-component system cell cycle response regulator DivK